MAGTSQFQLVLTRALDLFSPALGPSGSVALGPLHYPVLARLESTGAGLSRAGLSTQHLPCACVTLVLKPWGMNAYNVS